VKKFYDKVYDAVKKIPKGKVSTYGRIAVLCGNPRCARAVGYALHQNPDPENIPCHRVVFKDGSLSPAFAFGGKNRQYRLLKAEGVKFSKDKKVKLTFN
jgi:methylated-DNA-protein-cysteine methyltransferase-like protein